MTKDRREGLVAVMNFGKMGCEKETRKEEPLRENIE